MGWREVFHQSFRDCPDNSLWGGFQCQNGEMRAYFELSFLTDDCNGTYIDSGQIGLQDLTTLHFRVRLTGYDWRKWEKPSTNPAVDCASLRVYVAFKFYDSQGNIIKFVDGSEKIEYRYIDETHCETIETQDTIEHSIEHDSSGNVYLKVNGETKVSKVLSSPPTFVVYEIRVWACGQNREIGEVAFKVYEKRVVWDLYVEEYVEEDGGGGGGGGGGTLPPPGGELQDVVAGMMSMFMFMMFFMMLFSLISALA